MPIKSSDILINGKKFPLIHVAFNPPVAPAETSTHLFRLSVVATKLPRGFFLNSIGGGLIGKTDTTYCTLESGEHMRKCGYDPATYGSGQVVVLQSQHVSLGLCQCN